MPFKYKLTKRDVTELKYHLGETPKLSGYYQPLRLATLENRGNTEIWECLIFTLLIIR